MKTYAKVPKANADLVALLLSRGLVADSASLLQILETVGYYRFTGYLHVRPNVFEQWLMALKNPPAGLTPENA